MGWTGAVQNDLSNRGYDPNVFLNKSGDTVNVYYNCQNCSLYYRNSGQCVYDSNTNQWKQATIPVWSQEADSMGDCPVEDIEKVNQSVPVFTNCSRNQDCVLDLSTEQKSCNSIQGIQTTTYQIKQTQNGNGKDCNTVAREKGITLPGYSTSTYDPNSNLVSIVSSCPKDIDCVISSNPGPTSCDTTTGESTTYYPIQTNSSGQGKSCNIVASDQFPSKTFIIQGSNVIVKDICQKGSNKIIYIGIGILVIVVIFFLLRRKN
jgi:hypothetical protein